MALETFCTNLACRRRFLFPDTTAGKTVRCQSCGETFVATASASATSPAPPRPAKAAPPPPDLVGSTLGRFVVREKLGAGAFGTVYRAFDPILDRDVALKVPNPGVMSEPKRVERFLREAKAAAQLRHPHIVGVFDAGQDGDRYYIASAFIEGRPLSDTIPPGGAEFVRAARQVRELAEALAYAHGQGVVHRDVKPANVMVDGHGRTHLMDFGLAARQDSEDRITHDGAVMGTPSYMAPEQAAGQKGEAQPAVDQYAAGVVLYELLTGHPPFEGRIQVVLHNVIHTPPDAPRVHRPDVPRDLETICLKAMSKRPEDRYADCQALADDLRRFLEGEPIAARRLGAAERLVRWVRKEPKLAGAGVVIGILMLLGAGLVYGTAVRARENAQSQQTLRQEAERERDTAGRARERAEGLLREKERADLKALGALGTAAEERANAVAALKQVDAANLKVKETEWKLEATAEKLAEKIAEGDGPVRAAREQASAAEQAAAAALQEVAAVRKVLAALVTKYAESIQAVQTAVQKGERAKAQALLDETTPEFRGWEWRHLKNLDPVKILPLDKRVGVVASLNPDRNRIVTTDREGRVKVWSATGEPIHILRGAVEGPPELQLLNVCFWTATYSPDGENILAPDDTAVAKVWNARTGNIVLTFPGPKSGCSAVYSPDGKRIVTSDRSGRVCLWDAKTGKELFTLDAAPQVLPAEAGNFVFFWAAFSPDGTRVITTGIGRAVQVWDAETGKLILTLVEPKNAGSDFLGSLSATFSPDGTRILTLGNEITVWNAKTGKAQHTLATPGKDQLFLWPNSVAFSPDGTRIVTALNSFKLFGPEGDTGRVDVWHVESGVRLLTLMPKGGNSVTWSKDGSSIAVGCDDAVVRVFTGDQKPGQVPVFFEKK